MRLLTIILFFVAGSIQAQNVLSISGVVTDAADKGLPGATISLMDTTGALITGTVSGADGGFSIQSERGMYLVEIAFLGFETRRQRVSLFRSAAELGRLSLVESAVNLESVEVADKAPTGSQKEDTIQYNATAFKTMKDASAEDLITKMPGVTMEGGQMKAQGENVQRVFVDGKPFFGNDPSAALKNLPAEVIDKIQVFDGMSEQAQFSGVQDGNTFKTINIVTKPDMRAGQFGKLYAGYGLDNRYQSGGNVNIFDGQRRISLIGMSNNINVQNFAAEDILGVLGQSGSGGSSMSMMRGAGGSSMMFRGNQSANDFLVNSSGGITQTTAFGVNYSDMWGKKVEVSGSYFFNLSDNRAESALNRQFLAGSGDGQVYVEDGLRTSTNQNHRANLRLEATIDSFNSIVWRPRATWQGNKGKDNTASSTSLIGALINSGLTGFESTYNGISLESDLLWRHKFAKPRRTLSVTMVNNWAPKRGENFLGSENLFLVPEPKADTLDQRTTLDANTWGSSGSVEFTEPITEKVSLAASYRLSFQQEESERLTNDFSEVDGGYVLPNDRLSNLFSNDYITHNGGLSWIYNPNKDLNITIRANYQEASLANDQTLPQTQEFNQEFRNVLPFASVRWTLDKKRNFRLFYRSSTQLPAIEQLQNVVNNQNPLSLRIGNPNLRQSESHSLFMRYQFTDPGASRMFFMMARFAVNRDQVVNSTWFAGSDNPIFDDLNIQPGAQLIQPVNLQGGWNARSFLSYSIPFRFIKSNLNFDAGYTFNNNPGLVNGVSTTARNHVLSGGITISSNVSEKLDFTLSGRPSWNQVTNSNQPGLVNTFINQVSTFRFNWQIWKGFVIRTDVSHILNTGLSEGFNQNFVLWNAAIGKRLFKNERGEISLSISDILRQNRNIGRSVTETWIEDTRTNALQQVVLLTFTYNLRNFGKPAARPNRGGGASPWGH